jgi:hypothetical protein
LQPNPADEPFGAVPLTISAVLVDMRIGFAALSNLQPGQICRSQWRAACR